MLLHGKPDKKHVKGLAQHRGQIEWFGGERHILHETVEDGLEGEGQGGGAAQQCDDQIIFHLPALCSLDI